MTERNIQERPDGRRKPGRPRGSGKNQMIRRGLLSLPVLDTNGETFVIPVCVRANPKLLQLLEDREVTLLRIEGKALFAVLDDGTVMRV